MLSGLRGIGFRDLPHVSPKVHPAVVSFLADRECGGLGFCEKPGLVLRQSGLSHSRGLLVVS